MTSGGNKNVLGLCPRPLPLVYAAVCQAYLTRSLWWYYFLSITVYCSLCRSKRSVE